MAKTKKELVAALKKEGVEAPAGATNPQLSKLLAKAVKDGEKLSPPKDEKAEEEVSEPEVPEEELEEVEDEPRLTPGDEQAAPESSEPKEGEDYLRQYQVRKGTLYGSKASDPKEAKAIRMKEFLLTEPKMWTMIPRVDGESEAIKQSVNRNGYRLDFPKNTYLFLPRAISEQLREALNQQNEALKLHQISDDKPAEEIVV